MAQTKLTDDKGEVKSGRTIADELAAKQREISVSEFFLKNRHLLGFDNPKKALLTSVKEAVDNSVEYSEPVLVREHGNVKIVKIGEYIDERIKKAETTRISESEVESAPVNSVEALVYNDKTLKMEFKSISALHRHKLRDRLYKIRLTGNRETTVTGSHSVFALKNGRVMPYPVSSLKKGDFIVIPRKQFAIEGQDYIDLREWLKSLPEQVNKNLMVKGVSGRFAGIPRDWKRFDYMPLEYFIKNNIDIPQEAHISVKGGRSSIPAILENSYELMRFLGYYAAEGTNYNQCLVFSFGAHEEELIEDLISCIKSISGNVTTSKILAHKTAMTVKVNSKILAFVLKSFFQCGSRAKSKTVPSIVFNSTNDLQKEFLFAYIAGDGHYGKKITMATISEELSIGLKYLFVLNGIPFSESIRQESTRDFGTHKSKCKKVYYLYCYYMHSFQNSPLNWIPLEESGFRELINSLNPKIGSFNPHYRMINDRECFTFSSVSADLKLALVQKRRQAEEEKIEYLQNLLNGDIGFLKIRDISEAVSESPYVYDFSVPCSEKFLGGRGVIFLHNSLDACEEMKVAPELKIIIETVKEDRYRVTVEDNGPGIVKEQVGRVFGKLLYGSKFHRLKCSRGQQGIGICMSPDTLVPTANGNIKEIKDIVDKEKKEDIFVLRPDLKLSKQETSTFFKVKAPPYIVKLNVLGGKEIELSPENPVLVKTEQGLDWKRADCLSKGDYVAVAKALDVKTSKEPYTVSILDKNGLRICSPKLIKEIMCKLKKKYGTFSKIADRFGIKKDHVRGFTKLPIMRNPELNLLLQFAYDLGYNKERIYEKATRVGRLGNYINIPVKLSPKLFRFAGLIAGDGNIQKKRKDRWGQNISFWNNEEELIHDFKKITAELFGINARIIRDKRGKGSCVQFSSAVAANLLEKMGLPAGRKCDSFRIPPLLLQASNTHIAEYIRGLFDAEGSVSGKRGDVSFMITNEQVIKHISLLLLRFGVHSTINKAGKHKRLIISGRSNVNAFNEKIGFFSPKQANKLEKALRKECKSRPSMLVYPKMGQCILNAEKSLGMSHYMLKCGQAKTALLAKKYMAYDTLSKIFSTLKSKAQKKSPMELQEIYALLNSDIGWSKVTNAEFAEPKYDYVYDVTMARGNNFVANGIVVHNSASAMYGQLTTGKPIKIWSRISPKKPAMYFELFIDTRKNEPNITKQEEVQWDEKEHGIKLEIELEAKYTKGKQSVDDYLKQVAIANPHAHIVYITPEKEIMEFPSVTKQMPKEPKEIKPHPYGVELGMLMKMLKETKANRLSSFLQTEFSRVSPAVSKEICSKAMVDEAAKPAKVEPQQVESIYKAIQDTKIMSPPTDCLVPIGEEALEKGLKKEVAAEFYTAVTRPPAVYRGNPFQVEVGLAYGGSLESEELVRIMRFANRVPLLYQQSACSSYSAVVDTVWRNYGLGQSRGALPSGPALVLIHMSSVWVPFTSEAKEAIASYPEIIHEMKLALQECGRRLGLYIRKNIRAREQKERVNLFESYIPELADSLSRLSGEKKDRITESLQKMLKKSMKNIISEAMASVEAADEKPDKKEN